MSEIKRIILDIDSPTHRQTKRAIDHYQQTKTGLILPRDYVETCQGCGQNMFGKQKAIYFKQEFCIDCVDKWKSGHK